MGTDIITSNQGIIPNRGSVTPVQFAFDGQQIMGYGSVNNGETIVYTVPSKYTLLLTAVTSIFNTTTSTSTYGRTSIHDASNNLVYLFGLYRGTDTGSYVNDNMPLAIPMEVPEGYTLRVYSSSTVINSYMSFCGRLIKIRNV